MLSLHSQFQSFALHKFQIFAEREMVFSLRSTPQTLTQALQLRVRRPLTDESGEDAVPWQLRYLGQIQVS